MKAIFLITLVVLIYTSSAELVATMEGLATFSVAGTITLAITEGTTLTLDLTGLPTGCNSA